MSEGISIHTLKEVNIWQKSSDILLELLGTNKNNKVLLLLSGGSVIRIYDRIRYYVLRSKYKNLTFAQVDERFQPVNSDDVNALTIGKTGLWEACKEKKIHYYLIPQKGSLEQAAEEYNKQITSLFEDFSYKIGVFGIGEDAHTAGLIPGYLNKWNTNNLVVGYEVNNQRQNNTAVLFCPQKFRQRITLTPKALQQLDCAIVIAIGEKKRGAIGKALDPINLKLLNKYPAAILQKIKKVDLFTDILI